VLLKRLADIAQQNLHVGDQVYIEGFLTLRQYKDQQGIERYIMEITGKELQMLTTCPANPSEANGSKAMPSKEDMFLAPTVDEVVLTDMAAS
jgi:single-stranded DNA-binding protein